MIYYKNKAIYGGVVKYEHVFRFKPCKYLTITYNKWSWGLPFRLRKYKFGCGFKSSPAYYIFSFLCFHFDFNNIGSNIRDNNWPKDWRI